jgi:hypothetical protein
MISKLCYYHTKLHNPALKGARVAPSSHDQYVNIDGKKLKLRVRARISRRNNSWKYGSHKNSEKEANIWIPFKNTTYIALTNKTYT